MAEARRTCSHGFDRGVIHPLMWIKRAGGERLRVPPDNQLEETMKSWSKPQVSEQEVGLEVTSYLPAEIDGI